MKQIMSLYQCVENKLYSDMVRKGSHNCDVLSSKSYVDKVHLSKQRLCQRPQLHQGNGDGFYHSQRLVKSSE